MTDRTDPITTTPDPPPVDQPDRKRPRPSRDLRARFFDPPSADEPPETSRATFRD